MRILFFMPDNPMTGKAGNITRTLQMLRFLHDTTGHNEVDFLSLRACGGWVWTPDAVESFRKEFPNLGLILMDGKANRKTHGIRKWIFHKISNFPSKIRKRMTTGWIDATNSYIRSQMEKVVNAKRYDMIIVSYATWGKGIIDGLSYKPYLILDSHDFITAQYRDRGSAIGKVFQAEVDVWRRFDEIWTFSIEEKYIFEQFTKAKVVHIPISFPKKPMKQVKESHKYDAVYVASDNPHNTKSATWFLESVAPKFSDDFKIHVFGPICNVLRDNKDERFAVHGVVDDLQEVYDNARITICPMLSGTGVKIKVLESLSNNLPVVATTRGVDGLAQKKNNGCLVADDPAAFAEHVERLLKDDVFYEKTRRDAHTFISENHDMEWERAFFKNRFSKLETN